MNAHASLWHGLADPWVDLNPRWAFESWAYGVSGDQQVGFHYFHGWFALLWKGTADSVVDLTWQRG